MRGLALRNGLAAPVRGCVVGGGRSPGVRLAPNCLSSSAGVGRGWVGWVAGAPQAGFPERYDCLGRPLCGAKGGSRQSRVGRANPGWVAVSSPSSASPRAPPRASRRPGRGGRGDGWGGSPRWLGCLTPPPPPPPSLLSAKAGGIKPCTSQVREGGPPAPPAPPQPHLRGPKRLLVRLLIR